VGVGVGVGGGGVGVGVGAGHHGIKGGAVGCVPGPYPVAA